LLERLGYRPFLGALAESDGADFVVTAPVFDDAQALAARDAASGLPAILTLYASAGSQYLREEHGLEVPEKIADPRDLLREWRSRFAGVRIARDPLGSPEATFALLEVLR
jgi:hypothetical protein